MTVIDLKYELEHLIYMGYGKAEVIKTIEGKEEPVEFVDKGKEKHTVIL